MRRFGLAFSEQPFPTRNGVDKGTNAFLRICEFSTEANLNKRPHSVSAGHQTHHLSVPGVARPWPENINPHFLALF